MGQSPILNSMNCFLIVTVYLKSFTKNLKREEKNYFFDSLVSANNSASVELGQDDLILEDKDQSIQGIGDKETWKLFLEIC